MKHKASILTILLLAALFFTGAASASVDWEFDTSNLLQNSSGNYLVPGGYDIMLPVNITGYTNEFINFIEITATVTNASGDITDEYSYYYSTPLTCSVKGQKQNQPWVYSMARGSSIISQNGEVFFFNITGGLPIDDEAYNVNLNIYYGADDHPEAAVDKDIDITITSWWVDEITDNTIASYAGADKWSYTNKSDVGWFIIPCKDAGTFPSSYSFPSIARYNEGRTIETYNFTLPLTPDNATIVINKSSDKVNWETVTAGTAVTKGADGNITLTIAEADKGSKWLKVSFCGRTIGDVSDNDVIVDIAMILYDAVHYPNGGGHIDSNRLIYGDVDGNGIITLNDARDLFEDHWKVIAP